MLTSRRLPPAVFFALALLAVPALDGTPAEGQSVDTAPPPSSPYGLFVQVGLEPGVAADVGWQGTLLAQIRHSTDAKEMFEERYPGGEGEFTRPADGWYGSTAHRFRIGLTGTRTLSDETVVKAARGSMFSVQNQGILLGFAHGQVPAYLEASLHFGHSPRSP